MNSDRERSVSEDEPNDGTVGRLNRRGYMRVLGGLGMIGTLGSFAPSTVGAETADRSKTVDERIQEHRTGDLEVVVENPDGQRVENATVHVTQQEHDFTWGTAVDAGALINDSSPGDNYRTYIPELFNTAVLENHHKWAFWEDNQGLADDATNWLFNQGLDVRGHVCIWGSRGSGAIPSDVETAIDNGDAQTIVDRSMQHIEDIITHYGSDIHEWEVVNEVLHEQEIIEAVDGSGVNPLEAPILADWYRQAENVRPDSVSLGVNDYSVLAGNYGSEQSDYETQIQFLQNEGIDLGTIGLQSHFSQNETLSQEEITSILDSYQALGPGIKITEFDMADSGWSENDKADFFDTFLRAIYSHPGVNGFLMWGFWDEEHWQDDAPLFTSDWSEKPAYDVYEELVHGEWWTDETGSTDGTGIYTTDAYLGEHKITAETDSDSATTAVSVTDPSAFGTTTVQITVDG